MLHAHKKPENCSELFVPRVNSEIWQKMRPYQRKADIKLSNLQDTLIKGVSALMTASNDLLVCRETKTLPYYKDLLSQLLDATALYYLAMFAKNYLLKARKETIKPMLHSDFKSVCSRTHKVVKLLFGEDQLMGVCLKTTANLSYIRRGRNQYPARKKYKQNNKTFTQNNIATQVKDFPKFVDKQLKGYLKKQVSKFLPGQIRKFSHEWSKITSVPDF